MKGCKYCRAAVREHTEIADDEICFVCDTKLVEVAAKNRVKIRKPRPTTAMEEAFEKSNS